MSVASKTESTEDESTNVEESGISNTVSHLIVSRKKTKEPTMTGTSTSCIAESSFSFRYMTQSPASTHIGKQDGNFQAIFVGSDQPFAIEQTTIDGRLAFLFDPLPAPDKVFRLMDLPAELRYMIFTLVLQNTEEIPLYSRRGPTRAKCPVRLNSPTSRLTINAHLLGVNKDIRAEVLPVFYGKNTFHFATTTAGVEYLNHIGDNIRFIRQVSVGSWYKCSGKLMMKTLANARNLRSLELKEYTVRIPEQRKIVSSLSGWTTARGKTYKTFIELASILTFNKSNRRCSYITPDGFFCNELDDNRAELLIRIITTGFTKVVDIDFEEYKGRFLTYAM